MSKGIISSIIKSQSATKSGIVQNNINIASLPLGTIAINQLSPDFYSSQSINKTLAGAINGNNLLITSKKLSRDQKVETYCGGCSILLRKTSTKAVYFKYDHQNTGNLEVGVVTGLNTVSPTYSYYDVIPNVHNLINTKMAQAGQPAYVKFQGYFTYCVEGLDIWVQYNGVEFFRLREHGYVEQGSVGILTSSDNYIIDKFDCTFMPNKFTYSDFANNILDPRDYKMEYRSTTGSMVEGQYTITVVDPSIFDLNDTILVSPGGEATFHGRAAGEPGTRSVGGEFPFYKYSTETAMHSDKSKPDQTYSWVEETGKIWEFWNNGNDWYPKGENVSNVAGVPYTYKLNGYLDMAIPKLLRAKVVSKSGNVLTLDTPALCSTTNAPVHYDNIWALTRCTDNPSSNRFFGKYPTPPAYRDLSAFMPQYTIRLPEGDYAVSESWFVLYHTNIKIIGAGIDATRIFAPKGANTSLECNGSSSPEIAHFTFEENGTKTHYAFPWWCWNPNENNRIPNDRQYVYTNMHYLPGVRLSGCPNGFVHHIRVKNAFTSSFGVSSSSNSIVEHCEVIHTTGTLFYLGWNMVVDLSTGVKIRYNLFDTAEIMGSCELFNGTDCEFSFNTLFNGRVSSNSASGMKIKNCDITIRVNSNPDWLNPNEPTIQFNMNAYPGPQINASVEDTTITVEGIIDGHLIITATGLAGRNTKSGINIQSGYTGTLIKNVLYTGPGYLGGTDTHGNVGIVSEGLNAIIDNFTCLGTTGVGSPIYSSSIGITSGSVSNSHANTIGIKPGVEVINSTGTILVG